MSNLVKHALREMEIANVEDDVRSSVIKMVQAFADYGHSGGSASVVIPMVNRLLQFQPLTPLTDNPREWSDVDSLSPGTWQSVRQSEAFSHDGGRTYYVLSEQRRVINLIPWRVWRRLPMSLRTRLMFPFHTSEPSGLIIGVAE